MRRFLAAAAISVLVAGFAARPSVAQSPTATIAGLGGLTMATSATSDSAQRAFIQGVLLLHLFEYSRARDAFQEAQRLEPDFAMAYWGEAMTRTHPVWNQQDLAAGREALERLAPTAAERAEKAPTPREKAYLHAVEILYGDGPKARRDTLYAEAMADLARAYPADDQARLFHALALLGLSQGVRVVPTYLAAAAIADSVLAREPHNPGAAHYLIHGVDDPEHAARGLTAARALLETATDAGHGQHMASHIFMALGMWDDVVAANENAIRVVDGELAAAGRPPVACGHYPSWLEYGYLEQGRVAKARGVLRACRDRATGAGRSGAAADPDNSAIGSYVMMWTRYLLDAGRWDDEVAGWAVAPGEDTYAALRIAYTRGVGAARRGDTDGLDAARAAYGRLAAQLATEREASGADNPNAAELAKRERVLGLELDGLARRTAGDGTGAVTALERAAATEDSMAFAFGPPFVDQPAHELLAETLLALDRPQHAAAEFREALQRTPKRTRSLLGLARASAAAGDAAGAARAYAELAEIWSAADRGLPGLAEVRDAISERAATRIRTADTP